MRGLTPLERHMLLLREGRVRHFVYPGSPEFKAIDDLKEQGRMTERELETHFETSLTDLGRLALRACPVDEF